ncbi:MAG: glycosyltransferase family 4 protein [Pseudomonadota bacterium]|nr:glycosyltransferase family 4 protein [Pseudomonadota bacterium]
MRPQPTANAASNAGLSVLIVCENASAEYGGEAILPLHYFRLLRDRGVKVWLVAHARTRAELSVLFPGEQRIRYVEDSALHKLMWRLGQWLPTQLAYMTVGFVARLAVQVSQRRLLRNLIALEGIDIVHQPTPVSPREPSLICDVGAPVVMGPMNGGMGYPPAFGPHRGWFEKALFRLGRSQSALLNRLVPGKRRAALLLVANERTRAALPEGVCDQIELMGENGVELDLWTFPDRPAQADPQQNAVTFAFVGRLVALKSVDLLLEAFAIASASAPMRLVVIGDGEERERLQLQADTLFPAAAGGGARGLVRFTGWLTQTTCARELAKAQCLVMPSVRDCGGAAVLEAMSMAKPVIATAWGGALEYLDDSCGILVEPTGPQALIDGLAKAMVRLATSPFERATMGRVARRKIERHYDWEAKAEHILALYRQVLQPSLRVQPVMTAA